jgi:membrane-associated protease RseP (regulator of RpoE activity)
MTENRRRLLQLGLFLITIITTTLAGAEWVWGRYLFYGEERMTWADFQFAFQFSIPFLLILTCHEFGHYFTARYHRIQVSLPYYFPFWLGLFGIPSIGTMGAFIHIREAIMSRKHYFDVGVSGPIAGFVIALGVLWYGFSNLPEKEWIYQVHPEYEAYGLDNLDRYFEDNPQTLSIRLGDNLLMDWFARNVADPTRMPDPGEIIHYPWLLAGFLSLFFTALNLLPIGQLDGGHIIFGMFGQKWHQRISSALFTAFVFYAGLGWVTMDMLTDTSRLGVASFFMLVVIYIMLVYLSAYSLIPDKRNRLLFAAVLFTVQFLLSSFFKIEGYSGWLLFSILLGRVIGIRHPPVIDNTPLSTGRMILGTLAIIIFILCFTPTPLVINF